MNTPRHRHFDRRETLAYWPVKDNETGESVGLVSNLTEEGLQIHSEHGFVKGQEYIMRVMVDAELIGTDHISLIVQNVWSRPSGVSGLHHAGFKIVEISDIARRGIRRLLQTFSYPAPDK